jgi:hypothetical protein
MTHEEIADRYDKLQKEEQVDFLLRLMHTLTISVRGCYSDTPQVVNSRPGSAVGSLNEIQHQVAGYLGEVIHQEPHRAGGGAFIERLIYWARNGGVEQELWWALSWAHSRIEPGEQIET